MISVTKLMIDAMVLLVGELALFSRPCDGCRAFLADHAAELRDNLAARGVRAEDQAGDGNHQ